MSRKTSFTSFVKSRILSFKKRLFKIINKEFNPYPKLPSDIYLNPSDRHVQEYESLPLCLSWKRAKTNNNVDWQKGARKKLAELTGYEACKKAPIVSYSLIHNENDGFYRRSIYLRINNEIDIPVNLIWKRQKVNFPLPIMICLQGTNCGANLSWGEALNPLDHIRIFNGYAIAIDAAKRGYLAVCIENSCTGERQERNIKPRSEDPCIDAANHTLLLGRTLLGDRASDISTVLAWLKVNHDDLPIHWDQNRIHVLGHSAGGTVALIVAALDTRITGIVASSCIGFIRETIGRRRDPSGQNVIPGILNWMELDDIVGLCAPRPFLTVSGVNDHIWPFEGALRVVQSASHIYDTFGAKNMIMAVSAEGPHMFHQKVTWEMIDTVFGYVK